jgi:N-methylhydantoinase A
MVGWRVGVDAGGTFTDVCIIADGGGQMRVWKVASTPDDPSRAIVEAVIEAVRAAGGEAHDVVAFGHGTTIATNALVQHRGAKAGLITTDGFRDLLEIGRQRRPHLYDLQCDKPAPLVARDLRKQVAERLRHDGRIETPLDEGAVRRAVRELKAEGVEAIAVVFLYAYVDQRHEQRARQIAAEEFPEAFLTCSHEVAPEFREFERLSTAVVNAYLGPVMARYLEHLGPRLDALGLKGPRRITQSNGGVMSFATARQQPVRSILSGPATGVVGAVKVSALAGFRNLISFDMGGTSTDVALIEHGWPALASTVEVEGYPLKTPMLDIHSVGAGGGSIAEVDRGGHLKVGPRSAGARPGPVCYGLGNREPTVTDANVVLGTLNPRHLLGGRMAIDEAGARAAIGVLADRLGLSLMAAAQGIVSVVTATMAKAIRLVSVQRGHDPRGYTLVAFGGAGPLHASRLARELEIPRLLVPRNPGILCALGLLMSDLETNYAQTHLLPLAAASLAQMAEVFAALEARARAWFATEGVAARDAYVARTVDMRYAGQNHELPVAYPQERADAIRELARGFEQVHRQRYGYTLDEPMVAVTFRLAARAAVPQASIGMEPPATTPLERARITTRDVWLGEQSDCRSCPVFDRAGLGPGHSIAGPAIVEQMDATTLILPGQNATVDPYLNIIIEEGAA